MPKTAGPDSQLTLFEMEQASAREVEDSAPESASHAQVRRDAYDAWHIDFLKRFYTAERAAEIMTGGDAWRIANYQQYLARYGQGEK